MKKVFKYKLELTDLQAVEMPKTTVILSAQVQHGIICLWAIVDPAEPTDLRKIVICGTGHPINFTNLRFIDTVQEASLVWHVFERTGV
jgi:hypothetical protein